MGSPAHGRCLCVHLDLERVLSLDTPSFKISGLRQRFGLSSLARLNTLAPRVVSGETSMDGDSVYPSEEIHFAADHAMSGRRHGKVLLHPNG